MLSKTEGRVIYRCPLCDNKFRAEGKGVFLCPSCSRELRVGALAEGAAWDTESQGRWGEAIVATTKSAIGEPSRFFSQVAGGRGWLRPWAYALIISSLVFVISAAYQFGFQALASSFELTDPAESLAFFSMFPISVGALIAFALVGIPFGMTAGLLIQAGIYHACLFVLGAAKRGFADTFRVACYSMAPQVFQLLPIIGGPLAWGWQMVLSVIGIKVVHETTYGRSAVAVFLPMILCCGFVTLIGVAAGGWIFASLISKAV